MPVNGTVALSDRATRLVHVLAQKPRNRSSDVRFTTVFRGVLAGPGSRLSGMARTPFALMQQSPPNSSPGGAEFLGA